MDFLKRKVNTIFIMLGNGCNMNCVYCLQHPLVHRPLCGEINPEIYDFIRGISEENGFPVQLQFYGGEPLLYFKNIREIVEKTQGIAWYSIITNGRALTDEMVEFFNAHDFPVTISWDGPHVMETRGFDVFDRFRPLRRRILRLNRLGLSAVQSAKAYPKEILEAFQEISDEYEKLHGYPTRINIDQIFDTGLPDKSLLDVNYERVEKEMADMAAAYIKGCVTHEWTKKDFQKNEYIGMMHGAMKDFYLGKEGVYDRVTASCGNGYTTLNLDLEGNLYTCHNTSAPVGTIRDDFYTYIRKIWECDPTLRHRAECADCLAVAFCQGGCKLLSDEVRKTTYCKLKRAVFVPVLSVFQKWGEQNGDG